MKEHFDRYIEIHKKIRKDMEAKIQREELMREAALDMYDALKALLIIRKNESIADAYGDEISAAIDAINKAEGKSTE